MLCPIVRMRIGFGILSVRKFSIGGGMLEKQSMSFNILAPFLFEKIRAAVMQCRLGSHV